MRIALKYLSRNIKEKRPLGKYRHKWKGDIAIQIKEMVYEGVDWSLLAHL
jgi:hypothetical protein